MTATTGGTQLFQNHRRLTVFAAGIAVAAALLGSWALFEGASQSDASRKQPFGDAIATLQQDPGTAVARVNGVDIPAAKLRAYGILSEAGFGVDAAPKIPASQYLDGLVDSEVLYQEAVKEGFAPTDEAVHSLAVEQKTGLLDFIQQDTPDAANLRSVFDEVKGTPYGLDVYDTSPEMLDGFRRQIAVNALESHVISQLPTADQNDAAKRQAVIDSDVHPSFAGEERNPGARELLAQTVGRAPPSSAPLRYPVPVRLTLEFEREGSMPPLPGDGMELIAFLSFAISRGFGATHPLIALADRLHDTFHVRFGPLTTFYEAGPDDNEDRAKLELAWQQPGPLRESMERMVAAIQTDDQCQALLRRANAETLPAQAEAVLPLLRRAEESWERVRMVYTL